MEKLCLGNDSILTFPGRGGHPTELIRVTSHGQVLFNYKDWQINTATDLLFRSIAEEAPDLCAPFAEQQNKALAQCKASLETREVVQADLKAQVVKLTIMNQTLAENMTRGDAVFWLFMGMIMGAVIGSFMSVYIVNHTRD
jgi:hypothetical protein